MSVAIVLKEKKGASATTYFTCLVREFLPSFWIKRRAVTAPIDLPQIIMFLKPLLTKVSMTCPESVEIVPNYSDSRSP